MNWTNFKKHYKRINYSIMKTVYILFLILISNLGSAQIKVLKETVELYKLIGGEF